ncbi:MAG: choice-of-anchor Q domain-containing protein [Anaerolineales bacterium]
MHTIRSRRLIKYFSVICLLFMLFIPAVPVSSGSIAVDDDAPGCVSTPGQINPYGVVYCRIDTAITDAVDGDTLNMAPGTYDQILLFYEGKNLTLLGAGESDTTITGLDIFVPVQVINGSVEIHDVTIRDGYSPASIGGGISNNGTLTVYDSTITENVDTLLGGGISNQGTLNLHRCVVSHNQASMMGGGIYNMGVMNLYSTEVRNNQVTGADVNGGGIFNSGPGVAMVEDSFIEHNEFTAPTNGYGVGIYNTGDMEIVDTSVSYNVSSGTTYGGGIFNSNILTLSGVDVRYNTIAEGLGAGINHSCCTLSVEESWIDHNEILGGSGSGGGIILNQPADFLNVTISNNTATNTGGGVHSQANLNLSNVTLYGNTAPDGGAILHTGAFTTLTLNNVTISGNMTGGGAGTGGIRNFAQVNVRNSILAWNVNGNCLSGGSGTIVSQGYNLESLNSCALSGPGDLPNTDPNLGPLTDNGGPVNTIALLPGSPALEAGNPAVPGSGGNACEATDARLVVRPVGERCDIGAFESDYPYSLFLPLILR